MHNASHAVRAAAARNVQTIAPMNFSTFSSTFTVLALSCCVPAAHAQSSTPSAPLSAPSDDGLPGRVSRWWSDDWSAGWETGSNWRVLASPYTYHYTYNPEHRHVYVLGLERQRADGLMFGGSLFRNSFGQPSAYGYVGQRFDGMLGVDQLFGQLTGGILYGYRQPYADKVPLNYRGWSPGAVLSVGWHVTPTWSAQLNVLGNSALMFQFSADLK
jgi:hypothetical protein